MDMIDDFELGESFDELLLLSSWEFSYVNLQHLK